MPRSGPQDILRISGIVSVIPRIPAAICTFCSAVAEALNRNMTTCLKLGSTDGVTRRADLDEEAALRPRLLGVAGGLDRRSSSGRLLRVGVELMGPRAVLQQQ
jgi:hypothetical protein